MLESQKSKEYFAEQRGELENISNHFVLQQFHEPLLKL